MSLPAPIQIHEWLFLLGMEMIVELPVILPRLQAHVWAVDDRTTDSKARPPPTRPWLTIAACCSGMPADAKAFRKRLRTRCSGPTSAVTKTAMARRITEFCPYGHDIADKTHVFAMSILNTLTLCVACAGSGMGAPALPRLDRRAYGPVELVVSVPLAVPADRAHVGAGLVEHLHAVIY